MSLFLNPSMQFSHCSCTTLNGISIYHHKLGICLPVHYYNGFTNKEMVDLGDGGRCRVSFIH